MRPFQSSTFRSHRAFLFALVMTVSFSARTKAEEKSDSVSGSLARDQLVAWCTVVFDASQRGPVARAKLLKSLGMKRSAYEWREKHVSSFEAEIKAYQEYGIEFFAFWSWHDAMGPLVEKYGIKPQIWLTNPSPKADSQDERIEKAARQVLPVVKKAAKLGLKVALYNHLNWGGEPENLVAVCEHLRTEHGFDNVGICYNFHHGHAHVGDFEKAVRTMLPYLLCVNLNGVDDESKIDIRDLKQKIRPIGSGQFERQMLQTVLDVGYDGPFGILDHRPDLDTQEALTKNLDGLQSMLISMKDSISSPVTEDENIAAETIRPNVLIIYGDDQGAIDMGCFGVKDLKTPNMDRLAGQGLKLTQMYSAAPVCSASRIGLLTGRFPVRAGQPGNGDLKTEEITIAESFRDAGYTTGHVGKWHLGRTATINPAGQGFDRWFGHLEGCIDNFSHFFYWNGPNRHDLWDNGTEVHRPGEYFPQLMVERCKQFIGRESEKPWMLYWAFNAPHYPYQGTPEWLEHYKDLPTPRREYCAFTSTMDEYIGQVLDYLDESGLADNTIVIYQPDHGHSTETRAFGGGGNAGPYRGAKFSVFEGGIRVPSVVRYPGHLPAGESRDQFMTSCDWFPTVAQWCRVDLPKTKLDGVSMVDVLAKDADAPREQFYWQMGKGDGAQWAVRRGKWKLIGNPRDTSLPQTKQVNGGRLKDGFFLSDLSQDPGERNNLAEQRNDVVKELVELQKQWTSEFR